MRKSTNVITANGITISKEKLGDLYVEALSDVHRYLMQLYNIGVSASPSVVIRDEILGNILDSYPTLGFLTCSVLSGEVLDTSLGFRFVYDRVKREDDNDCTEAVYNYYKLLEAVELKEDIETIYKVCRIPNKGSNFNAKMHLGIATCVRSTNRFPIGNPNIARCIEVPDGYETITVSVNGARLQYLRDRYDLEDETIFDSEDEDILYMPLIISGKVRGTTAFGKRLYAEIDNYYTDFHKKNTGALSCQSFEDRVFIDTVTPCTEYLDEIRETLGDCKEIYMTNDYVVFQYKSDMSVDTGRSYTDFHIGSFLIDHESGKRVCINSQLHGLGGEFISEMGAICNRCTAEIKPISLNSYDGGKYLTALSYYPLSVVHDRNGNDMYPRITDLSSIEMSEEDACEWLGVFDIDQVAAEIAKYIDVTYGEHTASFRLYVGYLIQALVCVLCNVVIGDADSPSHVLLDEQQFSWVDSDAFESACLVAETVFKKL